MKILTNQIPPQRVMIELDPKDYWLKKLDEDDDLFGDYALIHRIDMSYKNKCDQEGLPFMYLTSEEAEQLKGVIDEIL